MSQSSSDDNLASELVAAGAAALARAYPDRSSTAHEYDAGLVYDAMAEALGGRAVVFLLSRDSEDRS